MNDLQDSIFLRPVSPGITPPGVDTARELQLWRTAKELESMFASNLVEQMTSQLPGLDRMAGGQIYDEMMQQTLADQFVNGQSLGIAENIYQHLARRQGADAPAAAPEPEPPDAV